MADEETFTYLPIRMDPKSKAITPTHPSHTTRALATELDALNTLHRALLTLEPPASTVGVPPTARARNQSFKTAKYADAISFYTLGLKMALTRPTWEPNGLLRDEAAMLYANRAQAHMELRDWVSGAADAECSVEAKKVGNPKAWYRRGRCLFEMGRVEEAWEWVGKGLEMEGEDAELGRLLKEVDAKLPK
ncbi:hypothetical protein N0V93_007102 [Gnomoniopsis smithogilvyi]|uniref:Translocation protein sec72 n=1 Tax=Gnomoniopsis smithogilvyi TaxID=1191159 RepID=A0A9W9CWA2_9PEZI|nr:hypothetical protein N0V93_007102 [Gnomoniopsis smithogilvyi]